MAAALPAALAGCSSLADLDPVSWWHDMEGGPIADARPPPPNADAPYPNLADAPDRPPGNDAARRGQIANALVADRANAQYDAGLAPLSPAAGAAGKPAAGGLTPGRPAPLPPAPNDADASNASLAAASAPPPPPPPPAGPPRRAPLPNVRSAPLPPPSAPPLESADAGAALPPVPDRPPPPPALPGVAPVTAPTPPVPAPPPPRPAARAPAAGAPAAVGFPPGSAGLPSAALPVLKALAQSRGSGTIAVTGYGEAAGSAPAQQQAAMPLALARARAIATYLEQSGVPASAIRLGAEAVGTGGAARLIR